MRLISFFILITSIAGCMSQTKERHLEKATFGAGCFWCIETLFLELDGVEKVVSGYEGGSTEEPTYKQICAGTTGHAEVIEVTFNSDKISFKKLLEVFWSVHDPTTVNRQGNDVGTQYRSVVFYHSQKQQDQAKFYKNELDKSGVYSNPIVTEISGASIFYPAEDYHQDYYNNNTGQPYCQFVIAPKVDKFRKAFEKDLK